MIFAKNNSENSSQTFFLFLYNLFLNPEACEVCCYSESCQDVSVSNTPLLDSE